MANKLYPLFKTLLESPGVDLVHGIVNSGSTSTANTSAPLKAALVTAGTGGYTYSDADQYWSAASSAVIGTPAALASVTATGGVVDAADVTFSAVASGSTVGAVVLFMDTGTASTSPLVAYVDTLSGGTAASIATNGGNITINWDNGANKIFAL